MEGKKYFSFKLNRKEQRTSTGAPPRMERSSYSDGIDDDIPF